MAEPKEAGTVSSSTTLNWDLIREQRRIFEDAEREKAELERQEKSFQRRASSSRSYREVFEPLQWTEG